MIFGRTDLRTGVSKAKSDDEADFELPVAPQKPSKNYDTLIIQSNKSPTQKIRSRKMKRWESSETRFQKFHGCEGLD